MSDDTEQRLRSAGVHLPGPSDSDTIDARERFLAAAVPVRVRRRVRRRTVALAFAAALVVAGAFGVGFAVASSKPAKTTTRIVHVKSALNAGPGFLPATDWDTVSGGTGTPGGAAAIAANVPLAAQDRQLNGPPTETARMLGPNSVLLYATFMPANPAQPLPQRLLPLQLDAAAGSGATRTLHARVAAYDVEVQITFGTARPAPTVLVAAREELGRLVVPSCPAAQPLTAADVDAAKAYVLGWLPAHYPGNAADVAGATATAALGSAAPRHGQAAVDCGRAVADRSIEVDVTLPKLARVSASLSQLTYFVARESNGWTVWMRAR